MDCRQVLDAQLIGPSWGINHRRYYRNFKASRMDFLLEDAIQRLPHHTFTEKDYRSSQEIEFGAAIKRWAQEHGLTNERSFIVCVEGMWGGYPAIRCARPFLLAKLLSSRDALRNVYEVTSRLSRNKLFVAVHIRSGMNGFVSPPSGECVRGKFNIQIPGAWYLWVCEALKQRFGDGLEFRFFSDRSNPIFDEAVRQFNPEQTAQKGLTECSDLLLMALADLRICSVSSYSLAASFLSGGPYVWYEPQLTLKQNRYTLWGEQTSETAFKPLESRGDNDLDTVADSHGLGRHSSITYPGTAMDVGDSLPESLVRILEQQLCSHSPGTNLLEYGCLPRISTQERKPW